MRSHRGHAKGTQADEDSRGWAEMSCCQTTERELALPVKGTPCKCRLAKNNVKHNNFNIKNYPGMPGWLSQLSVCLCLRS